MRNQCIINHGHIIAKWKIGKKGVGKIIERGIVNESATVLWREPGQQREYDCLILKENNEPAAWSDGMNIEMRKWLVGKADTMVLCGETVVILERQGIWVKVLAEKQETALNAYGYPGWVPAVHIVQNNKYLNELINKQNVIVFRKSTYVYSDAQFTSKLKEVSYMTRLPLLKEQEQFVKIRLPDGTAGYLPRNDVKIADELTFSRIDIINEAKQFLGLRYLWAGTVSYGFDCSGFTMRLYQSQGISISRNAKDQACEGIFINNKMNLQPGDLVFFARNQGRGQIQHVGMYIGDDMMIHLSDTSSFVCVDSINSKKYWGARRYFNSINACVF